MTRLVFACAAIVLPGCARATARGAPQQPTPAAVAPARQDTTRPRPQGPQAEGPKPYDQVIPKGAKTDSGVFIIHQSNEKLWYEIPRRALGLEFLLVSDYAATQEGTRYAGENLNSQVVRWQRTGNRVLLRSVSYDMVADSANPVSRAVHLSNVEPVLMSFDIAAYSPNADSNVVIEATKLFTTDVPELGARRVYRMRQLDPARSFIERVKSFPINVEVTALHTFANDSVPGQNRTLGSLTFEMHYSMVQLPERPMARRLCDNRVGYFSITQLDFGTDEQRVATRCYITRWRLEPKDSGAAVSDPVKPIVFYIDPATPKQWVPWMIKGVNAWEPAFRAAGFSNAIMARVAPTAQEDPNFDLDDARYSTIRWLPSTIENAYGPHTSDPRTGEILQTNIGFFHNVMNLVRDWYFVQVGPLDPRAHRLPLPDSLMGEFLAYVVTHEVGHTLGFPHNMKSSSSYPVDSLRSASFTAKYGDEASIMDYGRFNYVAQPGDGARLIPILGPYDYYAVDWGYRRVPGAATPEAERTVLDSLARLQDGNRMLRFGNADGVDPEAQTEDLGADAIAATTLGLKNVRRVMPLLIPANTTDPLRDYGDLNENYGRLIGQWQRELGHVVTLVGGVYRAEKYPDQSGVIFTPAPRARQQAAVRFLLDNAFETPAFFLDVDVLRRIEPNGTVDRIRQSQGQLLDGLFNDARLNRLVDQEALATADAPAYGLADLLRDVRMGLFRELASGATIDIYRRNVQRNFVDLLGTKLVPPPPPPPAPPFPGFVPPPPRPEEAKSLVRGELRDLDAAIAAALPRVRDRGTRLHLQDLRYRIDRVLNPR
ncbi:MAG TPA: zinc-dependent metalloprotease [Gemmatimonadales bacterium]|nr:zinc-dependent metalloprotease [Gemmatimonadales bacterium]